MPDFALMKFEGKALEKLIEVVSNGIGTLYKPRAIRKEADARAYEHIVMERAKSQALLEKNDIEYEEIERIEKRLWGREKKKQASIDKTVLLAANELKDMEDISSDPVDNDWATRFFNIVENISEEFVLSLWGKILAGEIKEPKSFSLRTLELLKNLTTEEAKLFTKLSEFAINGDDKAYVFYGNRNFFHKESNITINDLLLLEEIGLINADFGYAVTTTIPKKIKSMPVKYQDKCIIFENLTDNEQKVAFNCIVFTSIGTELLKLIDSKSNLKYLQEIKKYCQSKSVRVKMADIFIVPHGFGGKNEREIPD